MESKYLGKCEKLGLDYFSDQVQITFTLLDADKSVIAEEWRRLEGKNIDVIFKEHKHGRSLSANAYFHSICHKIAEVINESDAFVKNILIGRYGQPELDENGDTYTIKSNLSADKMLNQESLHLKPMGTTVENGRELFWYRVYRATHTYDTKEFSRLLDGTIEEAKGYGIKIIASKELQQMLERWKPSEKCV